MPPEQTGGDAKCEGDGDVPTNIATEQSLRGMEDLDASFPSAPTNPGSTCNLNNNLGLDATEVFRASLEFQQSQSQLPLPTPLEERTSSSSLYPSLEFVSKVGRDIELERSWHDAAVASAPGGRDDEASFGDDSAHAKRAARTGRIVEKSRNEKMQNLASGSSWVDRTPGGGPFAASASAPDSSRARASIPRSDEDEDLIALKRAAYGGDYSTLPVHQTTDYSAQPPTQITEHHAEAFVIEENVHPSDIGVDAVCAEFVTQNCEAVPSIVSNSRPYVSSSDFGDTTVSALGASHAEATEATVIESGPMEKATPEAWSASPAAEATVLQEPDIANEPDRKPPAKNHSEPWAFSGASTDQHCSDVQSFPPSDGQEAVVTAIDYDVHPSEMTYGVARAEPDEGGSAEATLVDYGGHASAISYDSPCPPRHESTSFEPPANQTAEVTAVDYDIQPSEMAYDAVHAELSSMSPVGVEHQDAVATVLEYDVHPSATPHGAVHAERHESNTVDSNFDAPGNQAEVTVVDYDVHPAELSYGAVHAEFVGQDFNTQVEQTVEQPSFPSAQTSHLADETQQVVEVGNMEEATEATVIASGPIDKATPEAWSAEPASEAHVIEDNAGAQTGLDAMPPAVGTPNRASFALADGEAEVVDVSVDVHPSEFVGNAAEAELVASDYASDYGCAIAVAPDQHQNAIQEGDQAIVEEATYVVEDSSNEYGHATTHAHLAQPEAHEARATLIDGDSNLANQTHSVAAVLEEGYVTGASEAFGQPATPVTVMEESIGTATTTTYHGRTPKADPLADRSASAPTPSYSGCIPAESMQDQRAHSYGGQEALNVGATSIQEEMEFSNIPPIPPPVPPPPPSVASTTSRGSRTRSESSNGLQSLSSNFCRGMEMLFGNNKTSGGRHAPIGFDCESLAGSILPRSPLPSSVIYSEATNSWVATVNTNQKALEANNVEESSKALRAFSVPTKKQAIALARAWAPPRMLPFESNQNCFICETQFAVFRRACHCRNCGVVVCGSCVGQWPSKMLPTTYNTKKESFVKICKGCDWLCSAFRLALLHGERDKAVALHSTGNINLTTPFANVKGELFYPVHCAVLGGNLGLLQWLVDEHCCPLRSIRISHGKEKDSSGSYTPILTSKGRSLLGIALSNRNIGIVRYLVAEKRMLLSAEKGLSVDTLVQNLDLVLRVLPEEVLGQQSLDETDKLVTKDITPEIHPSTETAVGETDNVTTEGVSEHEYADINARRRSMEGDVSDFDECIICFSHPINCVATPCGHQICCLECSRNISRCPVCAAECSFMRVFKP